MQAMSQAPIVLDKVATIFNILQDYVIMQGRIKPGVKRVEVQMNHTRTVNDGSTGDSSSG